jgi:hypothetical protein
MTAAFIMKSEGKSMKRTPGILKIFAARCVDLRSFKKIITFCSLAMRQAAGNMLAGGFK